MNNGWESGTDEIRHLLGIIQLRDQDIESKKGLIARARDEIIKLQAELATARKAVFEFGPGGRAELEATQLQTQHALDEALEQIQKLTDENKQLRQRSQHTESQLATNAEECARFREDIERLSQMTAETQKLLLERETALAEWVDYGKKMADQVKRLEQDNQNLTDINTNLQEQILQLEKIQTETETQQVSVVGLRQKLETCTKKLEATEAERERIHARLRQVDQQNKKIQDLEAILASRNDENQKLAQQIKVKDEAAIAIREKLERRKTQLREVSEQLLRVQTLNQNTRHVLASVTAERDAALKEIDALKAELVEVDNKLRATVGKPQTSTQNTTPASTSRQPRTPTP